MDMGHMNSNLVGSAGFQLTFHMGVFFKTLQHPIVCYRPFPVHQIYSHFHAVIFAASDRHINGSFLFFYHSMDNGLIPAGN